MASDSLLDVIHGLVKRDGETKKEEKKLAREKVKAEKLKAEQEEEEDEDEAPVGDPEVTAEQEPEPEEEPEAEPEAEPEDEPLPPEEEPEDDGVDPVLVDKVVQKVVGHLEKIMQKVQDKSDAEKFRSGEAKMSGKKEKINTKPKLEQVRKGKMNFREAIRMSVTGTNLSEGYEEVVLGILQDEDIDGPLGYEPFFEKGKLFVEKGSEREAKKALQQSKDINKLPKIVGEELDPEEYLSMEAVEVDGRYKGFKEALKRLTYEKLKQLKDEAQIPEGLNKEDAASFMAAASAAKREGKKKFKFGDKEYPVTIKVDIPLKGEK
jgi:pilus assembly protein FimV